MTSRRDNRSEAIKTDILNVLSSCDVPLKKKKIISKAIKLSKRKDDIAKSEVKKALKALVSIGYVKEVDEEASKGTKKVYILSSMDQSSGTTDGSNSDGESSDQSANEDEPLPFAEVLRRRRQQQHSLSLDADKESKDIENEIKEEEHIDDEIRQLELELAADSDEGSDSLHSDEEESEDNNDEAERGRKVSFGPATEYSDDDKPEGEKLPADGGIIRSNLVGERIAPLPKSALPQMKRRKLKGIDGDDVADAPKKKRRKKTEQTTAVSNGLREAVKEVLGGYVARSNERIPFYCRVCSNQSEDMASFLAHKDTDFHKAAVQAERKATYCQACRKQFTSPVQMKEHLESKPHHDRMAFLRSRNQGGGNYGGRGGRGQFGQGGRGYSGRGRDRGANGGARRQWC